MATIVSLLEKVGQELAMFDDILNKVRAAGGTSPLQERRKAADGQFYTYVDFEAYNITDAATRWNKAAPEKTIFSEDGTAKLNVHIQILKRERKRLKTWHSHAYREKMVAANVALDQRIALESCGLEEIMGSLIATETCGEWWSISLHRACGDIVAEELAVTPEDRVCSLRQRVASLLEFGTRHRVELVHEGEVLSDWDTLSQSGLSDGAELFVSITSGIMLVDCEVISMYSQPFDPSAKRKSGYLGTLVCGMRFELLREDGDWVLIAPEKGICQTEDDLQESWIRVRSPDGSCSFSPLGSDRAKAAARRRFFVPVDRNLNWCQSTEI